MVERTGENGAGGELRLQLGSWGRLSPLAAPIRRAVFVVEQGIDESEEWDEIDADAVHWVALLDGEPVGCARLSRAGKIGRMAVLSGYRGQGIGSQLLGACVEYAARKNFPDVRLSAQQHARSFYERHGFEAEGDPHEEVGIPHQWMVKVLDTGPQGEALTTYMARVRAVLEAIPAAWVTGTLSELKRHASGHLYFTLVQTDDNAEVIAKCRSVIWRGQAAQIEQRFRQATGLTLANNQEVMLQVRAQSHAVHGFSLVVDDIHPDFTMGRLAARLEEIRRQLRAEGLYDRNRRLPLPVDYFRVAVLSPPDAAGLGDFRTRADRLSLAGAVRFVYFTATFQGPQTAASVCAALRQIEAAHLEAAFDAVVIIRGGGSEWDLASLNEPDIARAICCLPVPVLCGIGHERDNTIIDEIARQRLPTPSMVIDFIESVVFARLEAVRANFGDICRLARQQMERAGDAIDVLREKTKDLARGQQRAATDHLAALRVLLAERSASQTERAHQQVQALMKQVDELARQQLQSAAHAVSTQRERVHVQAIQRLELRAADLHRLRKESLPDAVHNRLEAVSGRLQSLADYVRSQDPARVLQRGYAIVMDASGKPLTDVSAMADGADLRLRLRDGQVDVRVKSPKK